MSEINEVTSAGNTPIENKEEEKTGFATKAVHTLAIPFIAVFNAVFPKNPVTGSHEVRIVPKFVENLMGKVMYPIMKMDQGGEIEHLFSEKCRKIMKDLAQHSKREFDYEVSVLKNNQVNAWCLPGGKVAIYQTLLEKIDYYINNKDQLNLTGYTHPTTGEFISYANVKKEDVIAALLGHEMTHADARHTGRKLDWTIIVQSVAFALNKYTQNYLDKWDKELKERQMTTGSDIESKQKLSDEKDRLQAWRNIHSLAFSRITQLGIQLYFLAGSRSHELEADKYGMQMSVKAGYDPAGALFLLEILKQESGGVHSFLPESFQRIQSLFHTHPSSSDRQLAIFDDVKHLKMGA